MPERQVGRRRLCVNGRFLEQPRTGVQRYALEILRHWDQMIEDGEIDRTRDEIAVLTPNGQDRQPLFKHIKVRSVGRLRDNLWEQLELPGNVTGQRLFNPCNSAPWIKRDGQFVTIHDASVFALPKVYGSLFRLKHQILYRRFSATAQLVITVSEFSKAELVRCCNFQPDRIRVIYSGCEHILERPPDRSVFDRGRFGSRPFILAVGSNSAHKNLGAALELGDMLRDRGMDLAIAGGSYARVFRRVSYAAAENIHWLGFVTDAELRALYESASLLVFPSLYEGFGFPAVEAMACGCPVILSSAASLPELGGKNAMYFDPGDSRSLTSSVLAVLDDPELRRRLVATGLSQAAMFTWRESARRTWDALT